MKRFTITHLFLILTWCAIAFGMLSRYFAASPFQGEIIDIEGVIFVQEGVDEYLATMIDEQSVAMSPAWLPTDANPPVSARSALAIADRFRREHLCENHEWQWGLLSIALYPLDCSSNQWCWRVHFAPFSDDETLEDAPPSIELFVLMNGDVIRPSSEFFLCFEDLVKHAHGRGVSAPK